MCSRMNYLRSNFVLIFRDAISANKNAANADGSLLLNAARPMQKNANEINI